MAVYEHKEGARSSFHEPDIQMLCADDFRFWRNANPETKNVISLLPLNVQFDLVCRQQYTSGFIAVDITPPNVVLPTEHTLVCKPPSDAELFLLNEYYGHSCDNYIPRHSDVSIAKFVSKVAAARYQLCASHFERRGSIMKMFNQMYIYRICKLSFVYKMYIQKLRIILIRHKILRISIKDAQ